ncbi:MAG: hypothetical protein ACJ71Q_00160 [Terriglobales bacterium]|jgi:hypothetical protein
MSQSRTICDCSSVGFGSSGERSSSFKAWPGFVLLRWFHSDDSKAFARSSKPTTIDAVGSGKTDATELQKRRAKLQELIQRAYAEMVARRHNR